MGTNERHEIAADLECRDGITKSLMTPTPVEKHQVEDSTLPEKAKPGSEGKLGLTPYEEHNIESPSHEDFEPTLERQA